MDANDDIYVKLRNPFYLFSNAYKQILNKYTPNRLQCTWQHFFVCLSSTTTGNVINLVHTRKGRLSFSCTSFPILQKKLVMLFKHVNSDFTKFQRQKNSFWAGAFLIKVINVGSDTFGNPIFPKGLQNQPFFRIISVLG